MYELHGRCPRRMSGEIDLGDALDMTEVEIGEITGLNDFLDELDAAGNDLGNPKRGWFKKLAKKVRKSIKPSSKLRARLKKAAKWVKKNGSKIVTKAAAAISTIYPPAAPFVSAAAKVINKGLDKWKSVDAIKKKADAYIRGVKGRQKQLVATAEGVAKNIAKRKKAGKKVPKKVVVRASALEKKPGEKRVMAKPSDGIPRVKTTAVRPVGPGADDRPGALTIREHAKIKAAG